MRCHPGPHSCSWLLGLASSLQSRRSAPTAPLPAATCSSIAVFHRKTMALILKTDWNTSAALHGHASVRECTAVQQAAGNGGSHPCGVLALQPKWRARPCAVAPPQAARCAATASRVTPCPGSPASAGSAPATPTAEPPEAAPAAGAALVAHAGRARLAALGAGCHAFVSAGACRGRAQIS